MTTTNSISATVLHTCSFETTALHDLGFLRAARAYWALGSSGLGNASRNTCDGELVWPALNSYRHACELLLKGATLHAGAH